MLASIVPRETQSLTCVDSLGYSEHSGAIDPVVAPTTAEMIIIMIVSNHYY